MIREGKYEGHNYKMVEFAELIARQEELHPDLPRHITDMGGGMLALRHPIIYSVPYHPQMNALINTQYQEKQKALSEAKKEGDFSAYVFLYERPYRVNAFDRIAEKMGDVAYHELLSSIWTDSENIWQVKALWKKLLKAREKSKSLFMDKKERRVFDKLPEVLTVYRGYTNGKNKDGFSYTLSKEKAKWFSERFSHKGAGAVLTRTIEKSKVFAYVDGRGEQEIIIIV